MASVMSWVIMTVVRPSVRCNSRKSSLSASRVRGSSAPNGSSISTMRGFAASARAPPTRWRWPPESSCGSRARYWARSGRPRLGRRRVGILRRGEPHQVEQFVHPRGNLGGRSARQLRRDADIAGDGQMRKQPAALEHIADPPPQQDRSDAPYLLAFDVDRAGVRLDQSVGEPQQRGLARTGAADDGQKLPLGDLERDVVDGYDAAGVKGLADIRIGDQGSGRHLMRSQFFAVAGGYIDS